MALRLPRAPGVESKCVPAAEVPSGFPPYLAGQPHCQPAEHDRLPRFHPRRARCARPVAGAETRNSLGACDLNVKLGRAEGSRVRQRTRQTQRRKLAEARSTHAVGSLSCIEQIVSCPICCSLNQQTANHPSAALLPTRKPAQSSAGI